MQLKLNEKHFYFLCAFSLSVMGVIMIFSASEYWAQVHYPNETPFYIKQIIYVTVALLLFFLIVNSNLKIDGTFVTIFYIVSLILLIIVLIPGIGLLRNGSRSWIGAAGFTIQPAELAKIATVLYLSKVLAYRKSFERVVQIKHFLIIILPTILIMLQPDFGSVFLLVITAFTLLFLSNYPFKIFTAIIVVGICAFIYLIVSAPYRMQRIAAFIDPWQDPLNSGFQAVQSLLAIGPAGLFGHGFLKSRQKYLYLPEPQNDFIFSILVEEFGLFGCIVFIIIFACFLWNGFLFAKKSMYSEQFYMLTSLQLLIAYQAILNIGVVIGLFPVTGVTLPFISYGGTSLLFVWISVALTLKIAANSKGGQNNG